MTDDIPQLIVNQRRKNRLKATSFIIISLSMMAGSIWLGYETLKSHKTPVQLTDTMASQCKNAASDSGLLTESKGPETLVFKENVRRPKSGRELILSAAYTAEACDAYKITDLCIGVECDGNNALNLVLTSRLSYGLQ